MSIHSGLLTEKFDINLAVQAPKIQDSLSNFQVRYKYPLPELQKKCFYPHLFKIKVFEETASEQHS